MEKKALTLIAVACIIIAVISFAVYHNYELMQQVKNSSSTALSLSANNFAVYKQDYNWLGLNGSETVTRYVFWNITSTNDNIANIQVLYYWVKGPSYNLTFPKVQTNITVNMNTREVFNYNNQSNELPFGSIFPYWISPSARHDDHIDTSYGQSVVYQAQETIHVFNSNHECWLINNFVSGNDGYTNYDRYYDKKTGICLETQSDNLINGTMIHEYETLIKTNISQLV